MRTTNLALSLALTLGTVSGAAEHTSPAVPPAGTALSARDISVQVDKVLRDTYTSTVQKLKLTTCSYVVSDGAMRCSDTPRTKILQTIQKDYGKNDRDSRAVSILLEPASDKGIGTLSFDYDDPAKDADTWIYLPTLGKVKRLVSSSDDNDESGSFFGTEFSMEDMENLRIDDFTYRIAGEATFEQRPVWLVESTPVASKAKKSKYSRTVSYVDKERFITLKTDYYNRRGDLFKQLVRKRNEQVNGVWISRKAVMTNIATRRVTHMDLVSVAFNVNVPDEFLTQRTLTDFAFREKVLQQLVANVK